MTEGKGQGEELTFSDNQDDNVELIEALKSNQPSFMTPPRGSQGMTTTSTMPSWLSNSVSKKHSLQPMSTLVKNIITKYAAHASKRKLMKSDTSLIKELVIEKVMVEVSTYKKKGGLM